MIGKLRAGDGASGVAEFAEVKGVADPRADDGRSVRVTGYVEPEREVKNNDGVTRTEEDVGVTFGVQEELTQGFFATAVEDEGH